MTGRKATTKGFARTSTVLRERIRRASESRGFAVSRLLTHWPEAVGPEIASMARPVDIGYGRQGFGATLTVLTTGAQAPLLEMQKETLRQRVNAVYGYNAISRVRITQTSASGFAEGRADFDHRPGRAKSGTAPDPQTTKAAADLAAPVENENLRRALEDLARNVLSKPRQ